MRSAAAGWARKLSFSLADQGSLSAANFLLNVLLVRWIAATDYGVFSVASSVLLFLATLHVAFVVEPMSVLGAARSHEELPAYRRSAFRIHVVLSLLLGLLTAISALLAGPSRPLGLCLGALALTLPFVFTLAVARQGCYLSTYPDLAALGGVGYAVLLIVGAGLLRVSGRASSAGAILITGMASLVAGAAVFWSLRARSRMDAVSVGARYDRVWADHWQYGKWIASAGVLNYAAHAIYVPVVAAMLSLTEAGALKAMQNLIVPLMIAETAVYQLVLPWIIRESEAQGRTSMSRKLSQIGWAVFSGAALYVAALLLAGPYLVEAVYGPTLFREYLWILVPLGMSALVVAASFVLSLSVRAYRRPDILLWSKGVPAVVVLTFGLYAISKWKLTGAMVSLIGAGLLEAATLWVCLRSSNAKGKSGGGPAGIVGGIVPDVE